MLCLERTAQTKSRRSSETFRDNTARTSLDVGRRGQGAKTCSGRRGVAVLHSRTDARGGSRLRQGGHGSRHVETLFFMELDGNGKVTPHVQRVEEHVKRRLRELSNPRGDFVCQLLEDVRRLKYDPAEAGEEENEEEVLAKSLTVMGYLVDKVSPCHTATASKTGTGESQRRRSGSWHPSTYSHGFLTVKVTAQEGGRKYLVEPRFRDHFVIQGPTARYSEVLNILPEEYVGPVDRFMDLVKVLCREMADAFASTGRPLPPWRTCEKVASKWEELSSCEDSCSAAASPMEGSSESPDCGSLDFKRLSLEEVESDHRDRRGRETSVLSEALRYRVAHPQSRGAGRAEKVLGSSICWPRRGFANHRTDVIDGSEDITGAYCRFGEAQPVQGIENIDPQVSRGARVSVMAQYEKGWFGLLTKMPPGVRNLGAVVH